MPERRLTRTTLDALKYALNSAAQQPTRRLKLDFGQVAAHAFEAIDLGADERCNLLRISAL
jgi:hypothetical protein